MSAITGVPRSSEWGVVRDGVGREFRVLKIENLHLTEASMKLFKLEGDVLARMERVRNMSVNDNDVVILAFPKSGTHWIWEILNMLISGKAEYVSRVPERDWLDVVGDNIEQVPSPRTIVSHYSIQHLPSSVFKKRVKIVHISRNPKSVAVSMYYYLKASGHYGNHFPQTFSEFLPLFLDEENPISLQNQHKEIKRLAQFLEIEASDSLVDEIISKCEISKLRTVRGDESTGGQPVLYRKGAVSEWKNWFSVADNEVFDKVYEAQMAGRSLTFTY
ncbi:hypothetical protein ACJMK2_011103 [Sinanodonta woodiana]|uniref:Sulfotransferase domain-containing protein n=1 Tax=Sinanodonta woodiana TaxID=1069815 RepID=A0ABD3V3U6_SINWO